MSDIDTLIFEFLEDLLGEGGVEIASIIGMKESTAEELAEETSMKINDVRKVLYKLYDHRLASYRRIRDKTTGWYIYYWKLDMEKAPEIIQDIENSYLSRLEERLEHENSSMYFLCKNNCMRYSFEEAQELQFKCPQCEEQLEYFDNTKIISRLEDEIATIKDRKSLSA
ncbi:MAG: transcription factor E [Candidatus Methanofastidiosa archaeon]|nr:transcription factor E [Candidatus Methanofastidiosa archaeon]